MADKKPRTAACYHLVRMITRRSIRVDYPGGDYDNVTREFEDEILYELDPESDFLAQIRDNHEDRGQIVAGNEAILQAWRVYEKNQRVQPPGDPGFNTAAEIPQEPTPPISGTAGASPPPPPRNGSRGKATSKQIDYIRKLANQSSWAKKYLIDQCGMRQIGLEQINSLPTELCSSIIDNMKAEKDKEAEASHQF